MNLGFDIDGVISDFTVRFNEVIQRKYGISLTSEEMYSYDVNLVLGILKSEVADIVTETLSSNLPLNPQAKETLDMLHAEGHSIYLLTARSSNLNEVTLRWLRENAVPFKKLYHLVGGKKYLAEVTVDVVVEDNLEEALELTRSAKHVLLFDQPWNKTKNVKGLIKRVYSWSEVYREIQTLAAQTKGTK